MNTTWLSTRQEECLRNHHQLSSISRNSHIVEITEMHDVHSVKPFYIFFIQVLKVYEFYMYGSHTQVQNRFFCFPTTCLMPKLIHALSESVDGRKENQNVLSFYTNMWDPNFECHKYGTTFLKDVSGKRLV